MGEGMSRYSRSQKNVSKIVHRSTVERRSPFTVHPFPTERRFTVHPLTVHVRGYATRDAR